MPRLSRELQFSNKVFSQTDLVRIVDIFSALLVKRKKTDDYWNRQLLSITTTTQDGVDYSFDNTELGEVASHLQQKRIGSMSVSYDDRKTGNAIKFQLSTRKYTASYFNFKSNDEVWLNHNYAQANEYLEGIRNQNNLYLTNKTWLRPVGKFLLAVPMTYILLVLTVFAASLLPPSNITLDANQKALGLLYLYVFLVMVNVFLGEIVVGKLFKHLDSLWPPIEINTGPDHLNNLAVQRKLWGVVSTTVILPIVISSIFYFISGVKLF